MKRSCLSALASLAPALLLAACASAFGPRPYTVPVGSTLNLERGIEVPAGRFSVWLQDGRYDVGSVNDYRPFCALVGESSGGGGIEPMDFDIVDVDYDRRQALSSLSGMRIAALGPLAQVEMDNGDGDDLTMFQTRMTLRGEEGSPLRELVCQRRDFATRGEYVSVAEMQEALGDYFTLSLATP